MNESNLNLTLTQKEYIVLIRHYERAIDYENDCFTTNIRLSEDKNLCNNDTFLNGPLKNQPKTSENWKLRAETFKSNANKLKKRSDYFKIRFEKLKELKKTQKSI